MSPVPQPFRLTHMECAAIHCDSQQSESARKFMYAARKYKTMSA